MINDRQIRLRAVEPSDVDRLFLWENDRRLWQYGDRRAPLSRMQLMEYAQTYDADPFRAGQLRLMIDMPDEADGAVGCVDFYDIDLRCRRAAIGLLVSPRYQNRGIGSAALEAAINYCRNALELDQLWALVAVDNKKSLHLFATAGFNEVGRLDRWFSVDRRPVDALILQKFL